jgi:hypothetical protein
MSFTEQVLKVGKTVALATGLTIGAGATAALADCTVIVSAANGKTLDGKNQAVGGVKRITSQMASGPKQSWEICSNYGEQWLAAARPYGAVAMRVKMECSGSWQGSWCKDVRQGNASVSFGSFKNYSGWGDGISAFIRAANQNHSRAANENQGSVAVVKPAARVETRAEVAAEGSVVVRRRADGFSEFKCGC